MAEQRWDPETYAKHSRYVAEYGVELVDEWLGVRGGEKILDLGCGDGFLTEKILEKGATVIGIDASPTMVEAAKARGIDAYCLNASEMDYDQEFDAVFSNAVLHWITDPQPVFNKVAKALKPGGRFIADQGGHGNVRRIQKAVRDAILSRGYPESVLVPVFYPDAESQADRLKRSGFTIDAITLFDRPTPLATGIEGWLETFAKISLDRLTPRDRADCFQEIVETLRPQLWDDEKQRWWADYVRLRFIVRK